MPLPPALAARLAKRGIIHLPKEPAIAEEPPSTTEEEIIAEDYDDTLHGSESFTRVSVDTFDPFQGYANCPNKWNVYHECSQYCQMQWKQGLLVDSSCDEKRIKMLMKYPLPDHWKEVLDQGIGRYYYWNTETDLVAWLPPKHPKCQVSRSAATLRKEMVTDRNERMKEEQSQKDKDDKDEKLRSEVLPAPRNKHTDPPSESEDEEADETKERNDNDEGAVSNNSEESGSDEEEDEEEEVVEELQEQEKEQEKEIELERDREDRRENIRNRDRARDRDRRGRRRPPKDDLDPMDPASYGECPRGTWSSGLPQKNEAKTGVDPTASGQLFQMRPYPSPGAVLRANAAATVKKP